MLVTRSLFGVQHGTVHSNFSKDMTHSNYWMGGLARVVQAETGHTMTFVSKPSLLIHSPITKQLQPVPDCCPVRHFIAEYARLAMWAQSRCTVLVGTHLDPDRQARSINCPRRSTSASVRTARVHWTVERSQFMSQLLSLLSSLILYCFCCRLVPWHGMVYVVIDCNLVPASELFFPYDRYS